MRVKLSEGVLPCKREEENNQVYVALEGEVCVRTDLVRSVTTDLTKQATRSDQTCCCEQAVFNQTIKEAAVLLPLPVSPSFSCSISFSLISKLPSIIDLIPRFLSL